MLFLFWSTPEVQKRKHSEHFLQHQEPMGSQRADRTYCRYNRDLLVTYLKENHFHPLDKQLPTDSPFYLVSSVQIERGKGKGKDCDSPWAQLRAKVDRRHCIWFWNILQFASCSHSWHTESLWLESITSIQMTVHDAVNPRMIGRAGAVWRKRITFLRAHNLADNFP